MNITTGPLRRRALLGAGLGISLSALAAPAAAAAIAGRAEFAGVGPDKAPVGGKAARSIAFLDAMMDAYPDAGPISLPQSYADQVGLYSTAFTYDAALAVLAYLDDRRGESLERAKRIGDALLYAMEHDPQYSDGRLREAYTVGPYTRGGTTQPSGFVLPGGSVNVGGPFGFTASYTGDQAWAAIALLALHKRTGTGTYLTGSRRLAKWIVNNATSTGPLGGFTLGVGRTGTAVAAQSTTHNADLVGFFAALAGPTGENSWKSHSDRAAKFVHAMWQPKKSYFSAGSPDGAALETGPVTLEAQTRPWLALPDPRYARCLAYVAQHLLVTDTAHRPNSTLTGVQQFTGVTVSTASKDADPSVPIEPGLPKPDPQAVWFEGTAQYAAALNVGPAGSAASVGHRFLLANAQDQLGGGQTVGGKALPARSGIVAASSPLHVGIADSGYYPARHVGATAWFLLADAGTNPLR